MATTWSFHIDWDNNNFIDSGEDISVKVISAEWQLGMTRAYIDTADNSELTLVLDNSDRRFSPENASSDMYPNVQPFRKVRIQSNDGTTTRTHWTGWIERIQPDVSKYGQRRVTITAAGPMQMLKSTDADIDVQYNKRTDQVIYDLLRVPWMNPPSDPDQDLLDEPPIEVITEANPEQKYVTMEISADNWFSALRDKDIKFNLYRAIADVTAAERGRFFFRRDGAAVFWDKRKLWEDPNPAATVTLDDTMMDMQYVYASDEVTFRNDVRVTSSADSGRNE